jgi:hypothetical protein
MAGKKAQNWMLLLAQGFGVLGSPAMVLSAVFPINLSVSHEFSSNSYYMLLGTAFVFSVAALRYRPDFPRWLLVFGLVAAFADIVSSIFNQSFVFEWITVALFLCYVGLLSGRTRRPVE